MGNLNQLLGPKLGSANNGWHSVFRQLKALLYGVCHRPKAEIDMVCWHPICKMHQTLKRTKCHVQIVNVQQHMLSLGLMLGLGHKTVCRQGNASLPVTNFSVAHCVKLNSIFILSTQFSYKEQTLSPFKVSL